MLRVEEVFVNDVEIYESIAAMTDDALRS